MKVYAKKYPTAFGEILIWWTLHYPMRAREKIFGWQWSECSMSRLHSYYTRCRTYFFQRLWNNYLFWI